MQKNHEEIRRKYRVAKQQTDIHAAIRDKYKSLSFYSHIFIFGCSIILCATVFAGDNLYSILNLNVDSSKFSLGISSILVFFLSFVLMLTNWDTKAEQHNHSHKIWFEVVEKFRNTKNEEDI